MLFGLMANIESKAQKNHRVVLGALTKRFACNGHISDHKLIKSCAFAAGTMQRCACAVALGGCGF